MKIDKRLVKGFGLIELLLVLAVVVFVLFFIKNTYMSSRRAAGVKAVRYDEILKDAKKSIDDAVKNRSVGDVE